MNVAASKIHDVISDSETFSLDAVKLVLEDFNQCKLMHTLPHYYVDMPTRGDCIIYKCYGHVQGAYKTIITAGLGSLDRNRPIVQLLSKYV